MLHKPAQPTGDDPAAGYKATLGVRLFILYALPYVGFVIINVLKPTLMDRTIVFGLNLAVVYGFGLILFALALALFYDHLCSTREKEHSKDASSPAEACDKGEGA